MMGVIQCSFLSTDSPAPEDVSRSFLIFPPRFIVTNRSFVGICFSLVNTIVPSLTAVFFLEFPKKLALRRSEIFFRSFQDMFRRKIPQVPLGCEPLAKKSLIRAQSSFFRSP
jgi:hypothetical protein